VGRGQLCVAQPHGHLLAAARPSAFGGHLLLTGGKLALARKNRNITYAELLARNGLSTLVADGGLRPD